MHLQPDIARIEGGALALPHHDRAVQIEDKTRASLQHGSPEKAALLQLSHLHVRRQARG